MKEKEFDFMMAFKKYRNLKKRHEISLQQNQKLKDNWKEQIIINDNLKEQIKNKNRLIYKLKKELKGEKDNDNKYKILS